MRRRKWRIDKQYQEYKRSHYYPLFLVAAAKIPRGNAGMLLFCFFKQWTDLKNIQIVEIIISVSQKLSLLFDYICPKVKELVNDSEQGSANFFCIVPDNKKFGLCRTQVCVTNTQLSILIVMPKQPQADCKQINMPVFP